MVRRTLSLLSLCLVVLGLCSGRLIAQEEDEQAPPVLKVYDVRDLVFPVPSYNPPELELTRMAAGGAAQVVGDGPWGGSQAESQSDAVAEYADALVELVMRTVEPGDWEEGSGNSLVYNRGSLIALHSPSVQTKVQDLLTQLRKYRKTDMVSVHISFVTPSREAMRQVIRDKMLLVVKEDDKAKLAKLVGTTLWEAKLLALDGQRVDVVSTDAIELARKFGKEIQVDSVMPTTVVSTRPLVLADGVVVLDMKATVSKLIGKGTKNTAPPFKTLRVRGTYRIPDGAMLLTSGGTLMDDEPKEVYVLIRVDVIPASPKR